MDKENTKTMTKEEKDDLLLGMHRNIRETEEEFESVSRTIRKKEQGEEDFLRLRNRGRATLDDFRESWQGDSANKTIAEMEDDFSQGCHKMETIIRKDLEEQGQQSRALKAKQAELEEEYQRLQRLATK